MMPEHALAEGKTQGACCIRWRLASSQLVGLWDPELRCAHCEANIAWDTQKHDVVRGHGTALVPLRFPLTHVLGARSPRFERGRAPALKVYTAQIEHPDRPSTVRAAVAMPLDLICTYVLDQPYPSAPCSSHTW